MIVVEHPSASIYIDTHQELARRLAADGEKIDLLCTDTPYSNRTHSGHNSTLPGGRSALSYSFWTPDDVAEFVDLWVPLTHGWFVSITDHVLWPVWQRRAEQAGLYADFPPIPMVVTGSRVRLRGDGPSNWTYQLLVARPKRLVSWGTLRGAYIGSRTKLAMPGGKPLWAMREIVRDYSSPGDVVCDPCCGAGTTLLASLLEGRVALGSDPDAEAVHKAEDRIAPLLRSGVNSSEHAGESLDDDERGIDSADY